MKADYLHSEKQWDQLVAICRKKGVFGCDTEYYNVDTSKQSVVGRGRIHVWSIAVRTNKQDARGYTRCRGWMLPVGALDYPPIRELLEDKNVKKECHNEPVDKHAFRNHGIVLRGARDTLNFVKWKRPELVNLPGRFKLKNLMTVLLRRNPICTFKQLVADVRTIQVPWQKKITLKGCCSCGVAGCGKRKPTVTNSANGPVVQPHEKGPKTVTYETRFKDKQEKFKWNLEDIKPCESGTSLWKTCMCPACIKFRLLLKYSIEDSVAALQVAEIAEEKSDPAPWPYGNSGGMPTRPLFNQAVVEAIIQMEQVGFPRDKDYCTKQAAVALADEEKVLDWLYRWYVANSGYYGPHGRALKTKKTKTGRLSIPSGTDGIWTSGKKKLALFDKLRYPRSPVWQKGKVKKGKAKLDITAMEWIKDNCPESRPLIEKLLLLGRIRNGKKYLVKLRDAGDIIHPICGAGDDDEKSGAVTGRLGIKGELEAQQLPKMGEKDLYGVRRAIVA